MEHIKREYYKNKLGTNNGQSILNQQYDEKEHIWRKDYKDTTAPKDEGSIFQDVVYIIGVVTISTIVGVSIYYLYNYYFGGGGNGDAGQATYNAATGGNSTGAGTSVGGPGGVRTELVDKAINPGLGANDHIRAGLNPADTSVVRLPVTKRIVAKVKDITKYPSTPAHPTTEGIDYTKVTLDDTVSVLRSTQQEQAVSNSTINPSFNWSESGNIQSKISAIDKGKATVQFNNEVLNCANVEEQFNEYFKTPEDAALIRASSASSSSSGETVLGRPVIKIPGGSVSYVKPSTVSPSQIRLPDSPQVDIQSPTDFNPSVMEPTPTVSGITIDEMVSQVGGDKIL